MRSGAQSVERALAVLHCLSAADDDLGVSDVAARTGLSNSTAHRLLQALRRDGLVAQAPRTDRYHLGPGLVALGRRAEARVRFDRLLPQLSELAASTGESVSLGTRVGDEVLVVLHADSPQPLRFDQTPGTHIPVHASAIGKALLAFADDPAAEVAALGELGGVHAGHVDVAARPCWPTSRRPAAAAGPSTTASATSACARWRPRCSTTTAGRGPAWRSRAPPSACPTNDSRRWRTCSERRPRRCPAPRSVTAVDPPAWHLAELNVARLRRPLDHPGTAEFVAALDGINALAESSPGFVWRLTDDSGQSSSYVRADDDPLVIINLSVWVSPDHLHDFVFHTAHTPFLRRRREWFERMTEPFLVCWWVPAGEVPTVDSALARLGRLRRYGVSDEAFTLRDRRPPPVTSLDLAEPRRHPEAADQRR